MYFKEGEKMLIIQVCVGSSCHLKGAPEIIELLQKAIAEHGLEEEVILMGNFCMGKCNRIGVTIQVEDDIFTGVTKVGFQKCFEENVLTRIEKA